VPEENFDSNTQKKIQTPQFKAVKGFNSRGSGSNEKSKWVSGNQKRHVKTHQDQLENFLKNQFKNKFNTQFGITDFPTQKFA
jgi:hypothetical protein